MAEIHNIIDKTEDSHSWSPRQMLEDTIDDIDSGRGTPSRAVKAVVIFLDDNDGQYTTAFANAGMKTSEMVALMAVMQRRMMEIMGY